ncbi:MAG: hypothetical protein JWN45_112 [Acidobacteriaceae bacterium]|nr:hypothetical protein [Acidobacteriaceae bacterium]
MRNSGIIVIIFFVCSAIQSVACGFEKSKLTANWKFAQEGSRIRSISAVQPVIHDTLSDLGARVITYKDRGLLVKAADGNGWWLFEKVFEYSRNGRPFAVHTSVGFAHVEKGKIVSIAGCKMNIIIYDEDGDGSFETVVPDAFKVDHVPAWVSRQKEN